MAVLSCPACRTSVELDDEYLNREVECGKCGCAFVAKANERDWGDRDDDEFDEDRRRRRRSLDDEFDDDPASSMEDAHELVRAPANGMIWTGWIGCVLHLLVGIGFVIGGLYLMDQPQQPGNKDDYIVCFIYGVVIGVFGPIFCAIIAIGGHRTKTLSGQAWPMAAAIVSMATIVTCGICNPVTYPAIGFGIWTLVAINKPVVKWAIKRNQQREKDRVEL